MRKRIRKIKHLNLLIDYFGSIINLATHLGINREVIYQWKKIPEKRAYQIEIITEGKIKASLLSLSAKKNISPKP